VLNLLSGSVAHEDSILTSIAVAGPPLRLGLESTKAGISLWLTDGTEIWLGLLS